jgi:hypothetical protein
MGGAAALLDWDGDGDLDLVLAGPNALAFYRNDGKWHFTDVTKQLGITREAFWMGCAVGDYDNDGDPDLLLTGYNDLALLRNDISTTGHFTEVTREAGLDRSGWNSAATFLDLDADGRLDLYVARYVEFGPSTPQLCNQNGSRAACGPKEYAPQIGRYYRNRGGGAFEDLTERAGFGTAHGKGLGIAAADYDGDGRIDLYVANDEMPGDLFHNLGGGRVENVGAASGTAFSKSGNPQSGMGVDWGDYNRDGRPDLAVGTFEWETNALYRNEGRGLFSERGVPAGMGLASWMWVSFTAKFFDYDNDGAVDLLITNGHIQSNVAQVRGNTDYRQPPQLLRNRGNGAFEDLSPKAGGDFMTRMVGRGAAVGDLDNDGDLDLVLVDLDGPVRLLENRAHTGKAVTVRLEGTASPRDGQGASLLAVTDTGKQAVTCTTGGGFFAAHDGRVHLGLGRSPDVRRLEVRWPSGRREAWLHLKAQSRPVLKEGTGRPF